MNHKRSFNTDYSVEVINYKIESEIPAKEHITKAYIVDLLKDINQENNYTKHYSPTPTSIKVFLKGGSNLYINTTTGDTTFEKLTPRHFLSAVTKLHYNPGSWWTYFADIFCISLMIITLTGLIIIKGKKGISGRGGIELAAGILIPLLFLFL